MSAGYAVVLLGVAVVFMLGELRLSRRNEASLLRRGAMEPPDPVYGTMRWGYPATFVAMAVEGALLGRPAAVAARGLSGRPRLRRSRLGRTARRPPPSASGRARTDTR